MQSPTLNTAGLPVCSVCGEPITDIQDIEYDVTSTGEFGNVRHTRQFHVERCENIGHRFNDLGECQECDDAAHREMRETDDSITGPHPGRASSYPDYENRP